MELMSRSVGGVENWDLRDVKLPRQRAVARLILAACHRPESVTVAILTESTPHFTALGPIFTIRRT